MSSNGLRRISIRGGKFHVIADGEEVTRDLGYMDVVIVNAAPVSRAYYGDAYDPNRVAVPTCWSPDTQLPDREVPQQLYFGMIPKRCISYRYLPRLYSAVLIVGIGVCNIMLGYSLNMTRL